MEKTVEDFLVNDLGLNPQEVSVALTGRSIRISEERMAEAWARNQRICTGFPATVGGSGCPLWGDHPFPEERKAIHIYEGAGSSGFPIVVDDYNPPLLVSSS